MAIITISRETGSMGSEIARELSKELGLHFLDKSDMEKVLIQHGVTEMDIKKFDEKKPRFWEVFSSEREKYLNFMKLVFYDFARSVDAVIVGRGGQILLANLPCTLHVRIIASMDARVKRVKEEFSCDDRNAERIIRQSDHDRAGFHRFFFDMEWSSPYIYDMVINTSTISKKKALNLIKQGVADLDSEENRKAAVKKLEALLLSQRIVTKILFDKKIPVNLLRVEAEGSKVILEGSVTIMQSIKQCEEVVREMPGVEEVENKIVFIHNYPLPYATL
ncbi:MAG: hypothetical protein DRP87_00570 [Spirochaetes bacterium]|nr:MAG: hypothetical protein DRP87_00570 [Spirochaetota bacterium]